MVNDNHSDSANELTLRQPDDWHIHLRDGAFLATTVPHAALHFARAIVMPNLLSPITTVAEADAYRQRILAARPAGSSFAPLMTLYLTDHTQPGEIDAAKASGFIHAVKLYPAGATTNSAAGLRAIDNADAVLQRMSDTGLPLLIHGEVTDPSVDVFDREKVFIDTVLIPLLARFPLLKVVLEHITTADAVAFIRQAPAQVAATITPHHLRYNRNALFQGGLRPHHYCLPILKRERHRQALVAAATSGEAKFFLGTDSAPHARTRKENTCGCAGCYSAPLALALYAEVFAQAGQLKHLPAFACENGPAFYGLPRNTRRLRLFRQDWSVPLDYAYGEDERLLPLCGGETLPWSVEFID